MSDYDAGFDEGLEMGKRAGRRKIRELEKEITRLSKIEPSFEVIRKSDLPYGIRNESGYLLFFHVPSRYTGQDERYWDEVAELEALAKILLVALEVTKDGE
jgi:hypothetical protein